MVVVMPNPAVSPRVRRSWEGIANPAQARYRGGVRPLPEEYTVAIEPSDSGLVAADRKIDSRYRRCDTLLRQKRKTDYKSRRLVVHLERHRFADNSNKPAPRIGRTIPNANDLVRGDQRANREPEN